MATHSSRLVSIAIDFGTSGSGWAYSMRYQYEEGKTLTHVWQSGTDLTTKKAPTTVLIKPDGKTLEGFGYDAENIYADLCLEHKEKPYYYFRNFKLCLHEELQRKSLTKDLPLQDINGRSLPAKTIFSLAIQYMSQTALDKVNEQCTGLKQSDIQWVLTVPAIWTNAAKQFMREAAIEASIPTEQLYIALEPEAASFYCRELPMTRETGSNHISALKPGDKYMVVDAGGGTVDFTVHEVAGDKNVNEVIAASGGTWGSQSVNTAFKDSMKNICGDDVFKNVSNEDLLEMERGLELKKMNFEPTGNQNAKLKLPPAILQRMTPRTLFLFFNNDCSKRLEELNMSILVDKLIIQPEAFSSYFGPTVSKIIDHIAKLLQKDALKDLTVILMVGGFAESSVLKETARKTFPNITFVIPEEASLCVLKGAVMLGHNPNFISYRVLKYTYGIDTCREWKEGYHQASKKYHTDKGLQCKDCFDKHVEIGQRVKVGEPQVVHTYTPANHGQKKMRFPVYASTKKDPTYVDEDGCYYLGQMTVDIPDLTGDLDREVKCQFTFSGPELQVEAINVTTEEKTSAAFDFLPEKTS